MSDSPDVMVVRSSEAPETPTTKVDLVDHLVRANDYRTYLELSTFTTGGFFGLVSDRGGRLRKDRIYASYDAQPDGDDGDPVTFAAESHETFEVLRARGIRYDVIFVDSFHAEMLSRRDIQNALDRLAPGGVVLVHDCDPPSAELTGDAYVPGSWCGNTYQAFVRVRRARPDVVSFVVDTDYGCGVLFHADSPPRCLERTPDWRARLPRHEDLAVPALRTGDAEFFSFFAEHRARALGLVSVATFYDVFREPLREARNTGLPASSP